MPPHRLVLKKETRMLGAVQVMMGLINGALGRIWLLFYTRQFGEISTEYKPVALLSGYPSWTFLFFIISGVLTIETEKKRSPNLARFASLPLEIVTGFLKFLFMFMAVMFSECHVLATKNRRTALGLILIGFEVTLVLFKRGTVFWQEKTAVNLSVCLWMSSIMDLIIARKVVEWGNEAFYRHRYVLRP